jgi:hypothetical protein
MKKVKLIGLLAIFAIAFLHFNLGLFNRFNFLTAHWDRWMGNERIIIYGELQETDSLMTALAPQFGFRYERQEDCTVTRSFVEGVKDYNEIMSQAITTRLGEDWNIKLEKEISKYRPL